MKILIVSFDKTLVDSLKEHLAQHEVYTAKNAEEAITLSPPDVELIIFDAISGAISEEEINELYAKKFKTQKYVILYDELFPVDPKNIHPPNKVLVLRDSPPEEIIKRAFEEKKEESSKEEGIEIGASVPIEEELKKEEKEEVKGEEKTERLKVLVVSFDKKLTDNLTSALKGKFDVEVVRNVKSVKEKGLKADVIVYDAISGSIAEKNLMELAEIPEIRNKHFIILVDELFPIDVEKIDLPNKIVINRDAEVGVIVGEIEKISPEVKKEEVKAEEVKEEKAEEEIPEEVPQEVEEVKEEIPETKEIKPSEGITKEEIPQTAQVLVEKLSDERFVRSLLVEAISKELHGIREEIKAEVRDYVKDVLESAIREELERAFAEIGITKVIREETRKIVEEKLKELLK